MINVQSDSGKFALQESTRKRFEKGQFERRARMEKDDLENLLFRLFERQVCSHLAFA